MGKTKKNGYSKKEKNSLKLKQMSINIGLFIFLSGCEISSSESNRYDVLKNIDQGNFQDALSDLKNCNGFSYDECHLNRGMAYFGLAGYDLIQIGDELYRAYSNKNLSSNEKDLKISSIILNKFSSIYIDFAIQEYIAVLENNGENETMCNSQNFQNLSTNGQQSCLAINPVLLLQTIDTTDHNSSDAISVNLRDIYLINSNLKNIILGIRSDEVASVLIGNGEISTQTTNELDAIACLSTNICQDIIKTKLGNYNNADIWLMSRNNYISIKLTDVFGSIILLDDNKSIDKNGNNCIINNFDGECFNQPILDEKGNFKTITSTLVNELNNNSTRNSLAMFSDIGNSKIDSETKVSNYFYEICGSTKCIVTEQNLIEYLNK
jgi:hypothetical protein